jgi:hypothetical protein
MQSNLKIHASRLAGLIILSASLAACGGGGGGDTANQTGSSAGAASTATENSTANSSTPATSTPETPPVVTTPVDSTPVDGNHAPILSGSAITSVNAGQGYSFVPTASDSDGDHLQFSISSKPSWATFDTTTGRLSGTPTSANVGSYEEIVIAVTDGKATTKMQQFAIAVNASAATTRSLAVSWVPPTTNSDGSALTNLSGYRILYGLSSSTYTQSVSVNSAGLASFTLENLQTGKKYFLVMVSVNSVGVESDRSQEATITLM